MRAEATLQEGPFIGGLRAKTQEATLRAGLEASPLVRELGDLARLEQ